MIYCFCNAESYILVICRITFHHFFLSVSSYWHVKKNRHENLAFICTSWCLKNLVILLQGKKYVSSLAHLIHFWKLKLKFSQNLMHDNYLLLCKWQNRNQLELTPKAFTQTCTVEGQDMLICILVTLLVCFKRLDVINFF